VNWDPPVTGPLKVTEEMSPPPENDCISMQIRARICMEPGKTTDPDQLKELHGSCKEGGLYDVECWIQEEHPLQVVPGTRLRGSQRTSALQIALERRDHALTLLLLCNGYESNLAEDTPALPRRCTIDLRWWSRINL
jgi:hypothetical protein